jgi:hypothetical protein
MGEISRNIFDMSVSQHFNTNAVKFRMFDIAFDVQNPFRLKLYRVLIGHLALDVSVQETLLSDCANMYLKTQSLPRSKHTPSRL